MVIRGLKLFAPVLLALLSNSPIVTAECSGKRLNFGSATKTNQCMTDWVRKGVYEYPNDFPIKNDVTIYTCPTSKKRVIISNGIPDHTVTMGANEPCVYNWAISIPLNPIKANKIEIPSKGIIGIALNGVPAFGAMESNDANAVEPDGGIQDAQYWYGHGTKNKVWHFHNPYMGQDKADSTTLLGYALDGFPIYGPYSGMLDGCNGRMVNNKYQYHVKTKEDIDENLDYCKGDGNPETNWNYILGCYHGLVDDTQVGDSGSFSIPTDCVISDDSPTSAPIGGSAAPTSAPVISPPTSAGSRPNFIVMQPDDMAFFNEWIPPPNNPSRPNKGNFYFPVENGLPNMETLRLNGLQMMEAYTASPACGTSRYSTITGKYPSRAASARDKNLGDDIATVSIPMTKLQDVGNEKDCTEQNIAVALKNAGYRTGMVGKWHLSRFNKDSYNYIDAVNAVKDCGFDFVDALYIENMSSNPDDFDNYNDGTFSHNMEFVTFEAINFINDDDGDKPFFLYVNPTVPHGSQVVKTALEDFSCRDTPKGKNAITKDFSVKGMTAEFNDSCEAYRADVMDRAKSDEELGSIWLDDSVGALLQALEDKGILDNTFFLFQQDHGVETKMALYENGNRIAQFIHYPAAFSPESRLDIPVSTIDIAATLLDFADVKNLPYAMDGKSWRKDVQNGSPSNVHGYDRCLFFEMESDRAVRCGCHKLLSIKDNRSNTYKVGAKYGYSTDLTNLFDLCGGTGSYITEATNNQEARGKNIAPGSDKTTKMKEMMECHLQRTYHSAAPGDYTSCEITPQTDPPSQTDATKVPTKAPTSVTCVPDKGTCSSNEECCSLSCNTRKKQCRKSETTKEPTKQLTKEPTSNLTKAPTSVTCVPDKKKCSSNEECCSLSCNTKKGICKKSKKTKEPTSNLTKAPNSVTCVPDKKKCSSNEECCSLSCNTKKGKCKKSKKTKEPTKQLTKEPTRQQTKEPTSNPAKAPTSTTCLDNREICSSNEECCSLSCNTRGRCSRSSSPTTSPPNLSPNSSCKDSTTWVTTDRRGKEANCSWVAEMERRCRNVGSDGLTGFIACPASCGRC